MKYKVINIPLHYRDSKLYKEMNMVDSSEIRIAENKVYLTFIFISLLFLLFFGIVTTYYGRLHVDEGFYFTSPYLVAQGVLPYRDFIYTQTPLHAYVYA